MQEETAASSRPRRFRRRLGIGVALVGMLLLPNIYWLSHSTVEVRNASDIRIERVTIDVEGEILVVSNLGPARRRFMTLPDRGDGTLTVGAENRGVRTAGCHEYVEGSMMHVVIQVDRTLTLTCATSTPLFSDLLILRWFFR